MRDCVLIRGSRGEIQKNQQHPSPLPCRMTAQRNLWIPNASFCFHGIIKIEFNQHLFSKQQGVVEGNSASDERSGKRTLSFCFCFFFIPDNGYCIRRLEYLLVQTHRNLVINLLLLPQRELSQ